MTHSGGKAHEVGDRGQRYEITVQDESLKRRMVVGWVNDVKHAHRMADGCELRPSWTDAKIQDRNAGCEVPRE